MTTIDPDRACPHMDFDALAAQMAAASHPTEIETLAAEINQMHRKVFGPEPAWGWFGRLLNRLIP